MNGRASPCLDSRRPSAWQRGVLHAAGAECNLALLICYGSRVLQNSKRQGEMPRLVSGQVTATCTVAMPPQLMCFASLNRLHINLCAQACSDRPWRPHHLLILKR